VRLLWQWSVAGAILLALGTVVLSLGFAGSPKTLPEGATIASIDVGGLSTPQAITRLERQYAALKTTPAVFTAGPRKWRIRPNEMILEIDWAAAVEVCAVSAPGSSAPTSPRGLACRRPSWRTSSASLAGASTGRNAMPRSACGASSPRLFEAQPVDGLTARQRQG
jgi:hypothetical protein